MDLFFNYSLRNHADIQILPRIRNIRLVPHTGKDPKYMVCTLDEQMILFSSYFDFDIKTFELFQEIGRIMLRQVTITDNIHLSKAHHHNNGVAKGHQVHQ